MAHTNCRYPIVFVHGMLGWGENEGINKKIPYWGATTGSVTDYLKMFGHESYAASVGPLSSAWDQACELYAQLTGTRVDYGKAHSQKYKHKQFGRTYSKPLFEGWSKEKKIHLVGHSFGGMSIRLLVHLLAYGAPEEVSASGEENVSELFKGGNTDLVCSVTAISTPLRGTDAYGVAEKLHLVKPIRFAARYYCCALGRSRLNGKAVDFHLEQFGVTDTPGTRDALPIFKAMENYRHTEDHIAYDLSPAGASAINERVRIVPNIYYFSFPFNDVKYNEKVHRQVAENTDFFLMKITSNLMLNNADRSTLASHYGNDGLVDMISASYPQNEPYNIYVKGEEIPKGVWNIMPVHTGDHGTPIGLFADKDKTHKFYLEITDLLKETESKHIKTI